MNIFGFCKQFQTKILISVDYILILALFLSCVKGEDILKMGTPTDKNISSSLATASSYNFISLVAGNNYGIGTSDGTGSFAHFLYPNGIAQDSNGDFYVADILNHTIRNITSSGVVTTYAGIARASGTTNGSLKDALFNYPAYIAFAPDGTMYVVDSLRTVIRKMTHDGVVSTFVGSATIHNGQDGTGTNASFQSIAQIVFDSSGDLYVADSGSNTIRKITPEGVVTTYIGQIGSHGSNMGTGSLTYPPTFNLVEGVTIDSNSNLYVSDYGDNTILKIPLTGPSAGTPSVFAGMPANSGTTDGTGTAARFKRPNQLQTGPGNTIYVSDSEGTTLRKITSAGLVTTVAGKAGVSGSANGSGTSARFGYICEFAVTSGGQIFIADSLNSMIRKIDENAAVTSFAGEVEVPLGFSNANKESALFNYPGAMAVTI